MTDHVLLRFEEWWVHGARFYLKGVTYTWVLTPVWKVWIGPRMIVRGFLADRVVGQLCFGWDRSYESTLRCSSLSCPASRVTS